MVDLTTNAVQQNLQLNLPARRGGEPGSELVIEVAVLREEARQVQLRLNSLEEQVVDLHKDLNNLVRLMGDQLGGRFVELALAALKD